MLDGRWYVKACLAGTSRCETLATYEVGGAASAPTVDKQAIAGEPLDAEAAPPAGESAADEAAMADTKG